MGSQVILHGFPGHFHCPFHSRDMTKLYEDVYISELRGALQRITNDFAIDEAGTPESHDFAVELVGDHC